MIANGTLKQLIISEYHMGVYHKGGSNSNGKTSIFDGIGYVILLWHSLNLPYNYFDAIHDYVTKLPPNGF